MEPQEVIDREILKWAARAFGCDALKDPNLLPRLRHEFATIQPARFRHMLEPLIVDGSCSHIPPATVVPHSKSTVTPYIAPFDDGGRLILIDPLNHVFLAPICCAFLVLACYDLSEEHQAKLFDFILVTLAFYSPDRYTTERLLNKRDWNDLSDKLMHEDKELGPIAEKMAFNMITFAFYHEVSHSVLGHLGGNGAVNIHVGGRPQTRKVFTWRQQQELDADMQGCRFFQTLISISDHGSDFWTGNRYNHAPLVFFHLLTLLDRLKEKAGLARTSPRSHPESSERLEAARMALGDLSREGKEIHDLMTGAMDRVHQLVDVTNLEAYLRPRWASD